MGASPTGIPDLFDFITQILVVGKTYGNVFFASVVKGLKDYF
jgi:hypothetical protein